MTRATCNTILFVLMTIVALISLCTSAWYKCKIEVYLGQSNIVNDSITKLNDRCSNYETIIYEYMECGDSILVVLDSIEQGNVLLNAQIDSLQKELDVCEFKIERIKYYNSVAAKNNNIKYLRGWINRVLDE